MRPTLRPCARAAQRSFGYCRWLLALAAGPPQHLLRAQDLAFVADILSDDRLRRASPTFEGRSGDPPHRVAHPVRKVRSVPRGLTARSNDTPALPSPTVPWEAPVIASIPSAVLRGVDGRPVSVEVHIANGLPGFTVVGLPDAAVRESRDRVRAAFTSSGLPWPRRRVTVNLAPSRW